MEHLIYTCGYGQVSSPQQLLDFVRRHSATLLDIRYAARSRNPQWAKGNLQKLFGADYLHLNTLGNVNYNNDGPIQLADPEAGTVSVSISLAAGPVILMCACKDHMTCHRSTAADYIAAHIGEVNPYFAQVKIIHLQPKDFVQPGAEPPKQLKMF